MELAFRLLYSLHVLGYPRVEFASNSNHCGHKAVSFEIVDRDFFHHSFEFVVLLGLLFKLFLKVCLFSVIFHGFIPFSLIIRRVFIRFLI